MALIQRFCLWVMVAGAIWPSAVDAAQVITDPFLGVRHIFQTETSPRPLQIHVAEIDLSAPGISFRMSPRSPSYPGPNINGSPGETNVQTTRAFANAVGAQIAVNGAFYAQSGSWANNLGLTASIGDRYSPWELPPNSDNNFDFALHISPTNQAQIVQMANSIPTGFETNPAIPVSQIYNAVTGSHRIINNGSAVTITGGAGNPLGVEPRTAVGLTAGNAKLILMAVDGRRGDSQGVTLPELANLLLGHGVTNAINLDGGGSTTMVMDYYGDGLASQVLNVPNGTGSERSVGMSLGVFANRPGDFDGDGEVDALDYVSWRANSGTESGYEQWRGNYGASGSGAGTGTTVPEPAGGVLMAAIIYACGLRRRAFARIVAREFAQVVQSSS